MPCARARYNEERHSLPWFRWKNKKNEQHAPESRFSGPRFPDDREDVSARERERDAVERAGRGPPRIEGDADIRAADRGRAQVPAPESGVPDFARSASWGGEVLDSRS